MDLRELKNELLERGNKTQYNLRTGINKIDTKEFNNILCYILIRTLYIDVTKEECVAALCE